MRDKCCLYTETSLAIKWDHVYMVLVHSKHSVNGGYYYFVLMKPSINWKKDAITSQKETYLLFPSLEALVQD